MNIQTEMQRHELALKVLEKIDILHERMVSLIDSMNNSYTSYSDQNYWQNKIYRTSNRVGRLIEIYKQI